MGSVCWFSSLLWEVFHGYSGFPLSYKNLHFIKFDLDTTPQALSFKKPIKDITHTNIITINLTWAIWRLVSQLCDVYYILKWYMKCFIYWTADLKLSKLWSSQLWIQFKQLRKEAWESQYFNGVSTRDFAIPVRRSNQLSFEATDVGSWSFVSSNEPVKNECEVIHEMFHILYCGFEICHDHSLLDFKLLFYI